MSDFGEVMTSLLTRGMVEEHFQNSEASSIGATTHTGSVYLVDLKPGQPENLEFEGSVYMVRKADVSINGVQYVGGTYVGYCRRTGAFLVLNANYQMIRRSSSFERIELLA